MVSTLVKWNTAVIMGIPRAIRKYLCRVGAHEWQDIGFGMRRVCGRCGKPQLVATSLSDMLEGL